MKELSGFIAEFDHQAILDLDLTFCQINLLSTQWNELPHSVYAHTTSFHI